jgi:hypothetical protein
MILRLLEILQPASSTKDPRVSVLAKPFNIDRSELAYGCPTLVPDNACIIIDVSDIAGLINVQHHCKKAGCREIDTGVQRQEREAAKARNAIEHTESEAFLLNIFCFKARHLLESIAPDLPANNTVDIDAVIREELGSDTTSLRTSRPKRGKLTDLEKSLPGLCLRPFSPSPHRSSVKSNRRQCRLIIDRYI